MDNPRSAVIPFRPVTSGVCQETIDALEFLLDGARNGAVQGLVFIAFEQGRHFRMGNTGTAKTDPVQALGPVFVLQQELYRQVEPIE
jgi:hypothetical protein